MKNEIDKQSFWQTRIDAATELKDMRLSVYVTTETEWKKIFTVHTKIIKELVSGRVLDAGCGYGRLSEIIETPYVGIDFSESFIKIAQERYKGKEFYVLDLRDTKFKDKYFDWAICISMKGMVVRELGAQEWNVMQKELCRVSKNLLILEYSEPKIYEIIICTATA